MKVGTGLLAAGLGLSLLGVACDGHVQSMMGPSSHDAGPSTGAVFMSVTPPSGATGASVSGPIVLRFGAAMASGMEQYVDLHLGDLAGSTVPVGCGWSSDRTSLTCVPQGSLLPHTTYVIHLGGGMMSLSGQPLDYEQYGPMLGGQWILGGMMSGSHGGDPWAAMGYGWQHANGSYGMAFNFTTG